MTLFLFGFGCGVVLTSVLGLLLHGLFTTRLLAAIDDELRHRIPL